MEPDFWKNVFYRSKMPEICRKTRFFGIFSKFHHQFFWFSAQRCILVMFKMWRSSIFKIFSDRKCRKYAGNRHLYGFSWDYSLQLFVFSHKNVSNGDSRCLAILILPISFTNFTKFTSFKISCYTLVFFRWLYSWCSEEFHSKDSIWLELVMTAAIIFCSL